MKRCCFSFQKRTGVAIYVVLFILMVLGLFAVQFHRFSRQAGAVAFKIEKGEIARQMAETCIDEAFQRIWTATENIANPEALFFLDQTPTELSVAIPLSEKRLAEMFPELAVTATVKASIVDFQTKDRTQGFAYLPKEGVGVFALTAVIDLKKAGRTHANCQMVRHHEYKIVSMLSNPANRSKHAQNFILDYALFARWGRQEYLDPTRHEFSRAFNNPGVKLFIEDQTSLAATKRGKIFFGGTDIVSNTGDQPVMINTSDTAPHLKNVVPAFPLQTIATLNYSEWEPLMPEAAQKMIDEMKEAIEDANPLETDAEGKARSEVQKVKVVFEGKTGPLFLTAPNALDTQSLGTVLLSYSSDTNQTISPGFFYPCRTEALLGDANYLNSIMESAIRQRFLYTASFYFDISATSGADATAINDAKDKKEVSAPLPKDSPTPKHQTFIQGVKNLETAGKSAFPMISYADEHFLFKQGETYEKRSAANQAAFPAPTMYTRLDGVKIPMTSALNLAEFRPYGVFTLRYRTLDEPSWLGFSKIYDQTEGKLSVRGIVRVRTGNVTLQGKAGNPLEFSGKGVLLAKEGFTIKSGIKRSATAAPDDFLVLFTENNHITIDTDQEIGAFLIAMGNNGRIIPRQPFKIKGGVAVDVLADNTWPVGEYSIQYDPTFKTDGNDLFQVLPSPQITFQKITESAN